MRASAAVLLCSCVLVLAAPVALGQDHHLTLMGESTTFTDVADAADDEDPFDLNITAQFVRTMGSGGIQREVSGDPGITTPGGVAPGAIHYVDIATASQTTNILQLGLEVGLWHDLHLYGRLPITLSDDRSLKRVSGLVSGGELERDLGFNPSFTSPTRSGLDHLVLGAGWGISNQFRNPAWPTWILLVEGHIGIGSALHPCSASSTFDGGITEAGGCRGLYDDATGAASWDKNAGSSRGYNGFRVETRVSRRYRYFEPYTSIAFQIDFPDSAGKLFASSGNLAGMERTIPPILGEANFGVAVIPWEHRARYQRFVIDFRGNFAFMSEGLDYSPLYDALGTSHDTRLTDPSCEWQTDAPGMPHACTPGVAGIPMVGLMNWFYGVTDVQQHVRIGGRVNIEMQAAKYVRFGIGAGLYWNSPYLVTFSDACNPNTSGTPDDRRVGACNGNTFHNPTYRDAIDLSGRRFRVDSWISFDLMASVTAMF